MNIYRNLQTNRLVNLFYVKPPKVLGHHFEEEDFWNKRITRINDKSVQRVNFEIVIDPTKYELVATA